MIASKRKSIRFPAQIEVAFNEKRRRYRAKALLSSVTPSIACYNVFLPTDWLLVPDTAWLATLLHVLITGWFLIAAFLFRLRLSLPTRELISISMPIFMTLQVLWIYRLNEGHISAVDYQYFAIMIVVYMNVNLRPDFRFALGASLFLCAIYIAVLVTGHTAFATAFVGIAMMVAAVYLTLVANWRMEWDARHAFLRGLQDRLHRQIAEAEADRDPLTGLFNRRYLNEHANALWQTVDPKTPMGILMLDVDYFKGYNDLYGHLVGDLCLKQVAAAVQSSVRDDDDACVRFGGEEFVVLLPNADFATASQTAERMRRTVESRAIVSEAAKSGRISISIGLASGPASTLSLHDLVAQADAALYEAKRNGRNRIWPPFVSTDTGSAEISALRANVA